jgi:hypothetical protein
MDHKTHVVSPRQLALVLDSLPLRGLAMTEREKVVALLARLLLEASSTAAGGRNDENV